MPRCSPPGRSDEDRGTERGALTQFRETRNPQFGFGWLVRRLLHGVGPNDPPVIIEEWADFVRMNLSASCGSSTEFLFEAAENL